MEHFSPSGEIIITPNQNDKRPLKLHLFFWQSTKDERLITNAISISLLKARNNSRKCFFFSFARVIIRATLNLYTQVSNTDYRKCEVAFKSFILSIKSR